MIVKVQNETFWFSTYSMEMHSLPSSSFIICLWGETFGSRTILCYETNPFAWYILYLKGDQSNFFIFNQTFGDFGITRKLIFVS